MKPSNPMIQVGKRELYFAAGTTRGVHRGSR
jgi:hypothetical protein